MHNSEEIAVEADDFQVAEHKTRLRCELHAALAICVFDETQAVGGMVHLRYVAPTDDNSLELSDSTLSSGLLLLDRFCKELRRCGARKHSWRARVFAHIPSGAMSERHSATVVELVKEYFADGRFPVQFQQIRRDASVIVAFDTREGRYWLYGSDHASAPITRAAGVG